MSIADVGCGRQNLAPIQSSTKIKVPVYTGDLRSTWYGDFAHIIGR